MGVFKLVGAGAIVLTIGVGLVAYWQHSTIHPSTQDAYVQAHVISISPEVTGKVMAVHVTENQRVNAGDPLFDINASDFETAVAQATAQVDTATQAISSHASQVEAAQTSIDSATVANDAAQSDLARARSLFDDGNIAQVTLDQRLSAAAETQADLDAAKSSLAEAQAAAASNQDTLQSAQATLAMSENNLSRTSVVAPVSGWISNLSLREGSVVTAYTPLFSMVDDSEWWVEANFKETDLARLQQGQPVTIAVDSMPDADLSGHIQSISRGSGATFALLPAENASGNWVKVTQRFAVRVALDDGHPDLRVGASATATVDTSALGQ